MPPQWKHGVSTTAPPGMSLLLLLKACVHVVMVAVLDKTLRKNWAHYKLSTGDEERGFDFVKMTAYFPYFLN